MKKLIPIALGLLPIAAAADTAAPEPAPACAEQAAVQTSPLVQAIREDDIEKARALLADGADVKAADANGFPPLVHAIMHRNADTALIRLLLEAGADAKAADAKGDTPLHFAVLADCCDNRPVDSAEAITPILLEAGADVNAKDADGWTPLNIAFHFLREGMFVKLLEAGASPDGRTWDREPLLLRAAGSQTKPNRRNAGKTRLMAILSSARGDSPYIPDDFRNTAHVQDFRNIGDTTPFFKHLIDKGANGDIAERCEGYKKGKPLILTAFRKPGAVPRLLKAGVAPNTVDADGNSLLMLAARHERTAPEDVRRVMRENVDALLAAGADVNYTNAPSWNPNALFCAMEQGHFDIAEKLIQAGADVHARNMWDWTPLMFAARAGNVRTARLLLDKGADVNARMALGMTPIMFASGTSLEMVKMLAEAGADLTVRDNKGITFLMSAAGHHKDNTILMWALQQPGMDIDAEAKDGLTALANAAAMSRENVLLLLAAGAKLPTEGAAGRKLLYAACLGGNAPLVRVLLLKGATPNFSMNGQTPLHAASDPSFNQGRSEVVAELLAAGADVHAKDDQGRTPLAVAVTSCTHNEKTLEVIRRLMTAGADPKATIKASNGWETSILDHAKRYNYTEAVELMEAPEMAGRK